MSPSRLLYVAVLGDEVPPDLKARLQRDLPADARWTAVAVARTQPVQHAVAMVRQQSPDADVLVIDPRMHWPELAWARLAAARDTVSAGTVLSPLCCTEPALSPIPAGTEAGADADAIDRWLMLRHAGHTVPVDAVNPACSLWTPGPVPALHALAGLFVDRAGARLAGQRLPADLRDAPPENALAAVRANWRLWPVAQPIAPGADGKPCWLHVLHGWGGGAAAFVRDLAAALPSAHHFVLQAHGDVRRQRYGEQLSLSLVTGTAFHEIARWPMAPAIADTEVAHAAYRARLRAVCHAFAIDRVLVSSLIGHSLEALDTGLPTVVVAHDYYPVWPVLHERFDDPGIDGTDASLADSLARHETPFPSRTAAAWRALRDDYVARLKSRHIPVLAPSTAVRDNLRRIVPDFPEVQVEPHGFRPFPEAARITARAGQSLRLLVLGRINGGKGESLLADCIDRLTAHHSVWLVGCGKSGERFFGKRNVHVVLDYDRDTLPALLATIGPDLALMPVTVSESFSFTLSELWAMGIVPVASRLGSLAERITHGANGWLFEPDADGLVAAVDHLAHAPETLLSLRTGVGSVALRPLSDMALAYDRAFSRARPAAATAVPEVAPTDEQQALAARVLHAERQLGEALARIRSQTQELATRGAWGFELDRKLKDAESRIRDLHQQVAGFEAHRAELSSWVAAVEAESARLAGLLQQEQAAHVADNEGWQREVDRLRGEESRLTGELVAIHHSTSWRLTKPLRFAARQVRNLRTKAVYAQQRLAGNVRRLLGYWQRHGAGAALERARQELSQADVRPTPILPAEPMATDVTRLRFEAPGTPRASIIIPVYNKFAYTAACLASIQLEGARSAFEVIVVDDGSSDETETQLRTVPGLRYHRNAENLGFIGACNAGAAIARGSFVVFLNNDTVVRPGWLDALLDTFDQHDRVGLVGAKLVYPDGRLQEAGGIIFSDGSGWNYGRFGDPANPAFNYVREADYCSGAAIAIRRDLFERLGGFDRRYAPAYYEDTDLAFQVREQGLRVLYQPASVVVHFEGITSGTDVASGTKRYQVINQAKFLERWAGALNQQPKPGGDIEHAKEHRIRGRVLVIDATTPEPDKDSGSVRLVNILRGMVQLGLKPTFFAENRQFLAGYSDALQQLGVEVLWGGWLDPVAHLREHGPRYRAIFVSRHYILAPLLSVIREYAPRARLLFDTVDLHYLREQRAAALENRADLARQAAKTQLAELRLVRAADVTLVVSPIEQALLEREVPGARVVVLSNVHEVAGPGPAFAERKDLYFVGGFQHTPNVDAVAWFVREIWPAITAALPDVRFHIVGSRMPDTIRALASDRIVTHGFVPSMDPFLDGCRLSVAPLRYGAGVKGKVNQSMAHGQPVVATSIAAEGMNLRHGEDVLVADDAAGFAAQVIRLYGDEALWNRLAQAGLVNIEAHFSMAAARRVIAGLVDLP